MPEILSRSWWKAREGRQGHGPTGKPYVYFPDEKYVGVEAHHSVTPKSQDFSEAMRQIQNFHLDGKKWTDIFYSFAIYHDGRIATGRGWNISQGTDTTWDPDNSGPLSPGKLAPVVFIGNYDNDQWTPAQLTSWNWIHGEVLKRNAAAFWRRYHRMRKPTACPGANIIADWNRFADLDGLPTNESGEQIMEDIQFKMLAGGINRNFLETQRVYDLVEKLATKPAQVDDYWKNLKANVDTTMRAVTRES